jgi:hypothetical protein
MQQLLTVQGEADWAQLRRRKLSTVLDPMVIRTAYLFFSGATGRDSGVTGRNEGQREAAWRTIDANVGALLTFVDAVLLWDEIPVFSATPAFPENRLLTEEPLAGMFWPICVTGDEAKACRASAATEAGRLSGANPDLVTQVVQELPSFGYEWQPDTPFTDSPALSRSQPLEPNRRFLDFVLSGLLFDAYAQRLSSEDTHQSVRVLQPRRARLLAQAVTGATAADAFAAVDRQVGLVSLPTAPTFLPLLLQETDILTPAHLADRLMVWRTTGAVREYRAWLGRLHAALTESNAAHVPSADRTSGLLAGLDPAAIPSLDPAVCSLHSAVSGLDPAVSGLDTAVSGLHPAVSSLDPAVVSGLDPEVAAELAAELAEIAASTGGAAADLAVDVGIEAFAMPTHAGDGNRPVGFGMQQLAGGRHQKLMYRAVASKGRYQELSNRLCRIWFNG